ncbi:MAG: GNAT family N-acetyltransferase [bacterium]|nr:GNAT family N-acetyltransferase [bacterium]
MGTVTVTPLENTRKNIKAFVKFAWKIYNGNPHWPAPLIKGRVDFIHNGPYHEVGVIQPFLAYKNGEIAGRIIAHYDNRHNEFYKVKRGCIGFFECIDDKEVSSALFTAAEEWLRQQGMENMEGPINFLIYDASGIMLDAFDSLPALELNYNPPYYLDLYTDYGFEKAADWFAYLFTKEMNIPRVYYRIRERVLASREKDGLVLRDANLKNYAEESLKIFQVFNKAWEENWGHYPLTEDQFKFFAKELKPILRSEFVIIAEYEDEFAGFILTFPDICEAVRRANGRLLPFGIFKMMAAMKQAKRLRTMLMGVLPEYRKKGLEVYFILETIERAKKLGYEASDLSLIVDSNEAMISSLEKLGANKYRSYRIVTKKI